jgi:flagellar biosynthesis protein FliQ
MDITVEGFQSWMWKGLTFLLPFLIAGYLFQLYNAYILYYLAIDEQCTEWQVPALSVIFLVLFLGNTWTAIIVVRQKVHEKLKQTVHFAYKHKYRFTNGNGTATTASSKVQ